MRKLYICRKIYTEMEVLNKIERNIYKVKEKIDAKSTVWANFYRVVTTEGEEDTGFVQCKKSKCILRYTGKSTSNMIRHKCTVDHARRTWKILQKKLREQGQMLPQSRTGDSGLENQFDWPYESFLLFKELMEQAPKESKAIENDKSMEEEIYENDKTMEKETCENNKFMEKETLLPEDELPDCTQNSCHEQSPSPSPSHRTGPSAMASTSAPLPIPPRVLSTFGSDTHEYNRKMHQATDIVTQLLELQREKLKFRKEEQNSGLDKNDEDVAFFISLLPHMKKLSPVEKLQFRIKVEHELLMRTYGLKEQGSPTPVSTSSHK